MEISYQNKQEDFEAFYDYVIRETEQGKAYSFSVFRYRQIWFFVGTALLGSLMWGATTSWKNGLWVFLFFLLILEAIDLVQSGFRPRYYQAMQAYKNQEKFIKPRELQVSLLPRILRADGNWLEISNSEAVHRWRWGCVDRIHLSSHFVFIQVGSYPIIYVPKRGFPSEHSFAEFGKTLVEFKEKSENQPVESSA